jgi:hypothetical protein
MSAKRAQIESLYQEAIQPQTILSSETVRAFLQRLGGVCGINAIPATTDDVGIFQLLPNPQALVDQALLAGYPAVKWEDQPDFLLNYKAERHGVTCTLQQIFECLAGLLVDDKGNETEATTPMVTEQLLELALGFLRTPPSIDSPALYLSQRWKEHLRSAWRANQAVIHRSVLPQYERLLLAEAKIAEPNANLQSISRKELPSIRTDYNIAAAHILVSDDNRSALSSAMEDRVLNAKQTKLWEETGVLLQPANQRVVAFDKPGKKRVSMLYLTTPPTADAPIGLLFAVQLEPEMDPLYLDFTAATDNRYLPHMNALIDQLEDARLVRPSTIRSIIPGFLQPSVLLPNPLKSWHYPWAAIAAGFGLVKRRHLELMDDAYKRISERLVVNRPVPITEAGYLAGIRLALPTPQEIGQTIVDLKNNLYGLIALILFHAITERKPKVNPWQEISF